jgi:antitoxin (DNA-binding transcriptional repressor) of toxin-antitoxin stability system
MVYCRRGRKTMITMTETQANSDFTKIMKEIVSGNTVTILSKGRPIANITPIPQKPDKKLALKKLYDHMSTIESTGIKKWTREELYTKGLECE